MKYELVITKQPEKQLSKIDDRYKPKILIALIEIKKDPYIGKELEGRYKGEWSYRVGKYRIIYQIRNKELIILIIKIAPRGGVYK